MYKNMCELLDEIFEAAEVIEKMIHAKEKQSYKRE